MELEEIRALVGPFDAKALVYPWKHTDPDLDLLCATLQRLIQQEERGGATRAGVFQRIWSLVQDCPLPQDPHLVSRATIPYLTEPWYC